MEIKLYGKASDGLDEIEIGSIKMNSRAYAGLLISKVPTSKKELTSFLVGKEIEYLAKVLKMGANLLLLDEPTNDLDVDTLRSLENALLEFPGCAVIR